MENKSKNTGTEIDLDRLKQAIPIVDLARELGMEIKGHQARCYNSAAHKHNDRRFSLGLDTKRNRYKCFACGEQGSIIDLFMKVKGVETGRAIKELAERAGLKPAGPQTSLRQQGARAEIKQPEASAASREIRGANADTAYSYIYEGLFEICGGLDEESRDYLIGPTRGLNEDTLNYFLLFSVSDYDRVNRQLKEKFKREELEAAGLLNEKGNLIFYQHKVLIPFFSQGRIVYLRGRFLSNGNASTDGAKMLGLKGQTTKRLFNTDRLFSLEPGKKIYICEGEFDTMILEQYGYNAVGILGVENFNPDDMVELFKGKDVVLALDNDEAGERATSKIAKAFLLKGQKVRKKELPEGIKDITDYFLKKSKEDFDALEEQPVEVPGIPKPKPVSEYLEGYCKTLGDGTLDLLGIKTGFAELDKKTSGLDGLIVLGGIAGQGKTSLALQLAFNVCELGTPTIFYSLEMPRRAIFTKILSRLAEVKYSDILLKGRRYLDEARREGNLSGDLLTKEQADKLRMAKDRLINISGRFYLRTRESNEPAINFENVELEINLIKAEHNNADKVLAVVDHLQVFDVGEYKDQIDKESKLITGFKGISERTGATIILISQKNKAGFTSKGLQTIKGSVDIVYLADVVMFLESEEEKNDKGIDNLIADFGGQVLKKMDLVIDKNRYNAPSKIKLDFNGEYSNFTERKD